MTNTRTKIAIIAFAVFMTGRLADTYATYYHSPNLALEGNPLVVALDYQWSIIFAILIAITIIAGGFCFRLATRDYKKPFLSEKINNQLFHIAIKKTAKRRYVDDLSFVLALGIMGILLFIVWFSAISYEVKFINQLRYNILSLPTYLYLCLIISFAIAYIISNKVVDNYLPELNSPSPN